MSSSLNPAFAAALNVGDNLDRTVENLAVALKEVLEEMHGGDWSIDINHNTCFVAVCRDFARHPVDIGGKSS